MSAIPNREPLGLTRNARAASLAFVTAFVTLSVQILVHRMISVKLLNNYAFLVISLTMLGFALSGVILTRLLPRFLANLDDAVIVCAALFALTLIAASAVFYHAGTFIFFARSRSDFLGALLRSLPLALPYALPFTFSGLILGALLSSPELPTDRIYCFDLLGSAAGAVAVLPAIIRLGVEMSAVLACALFLGVTLVLARPRRVLTRTLAALTLLAITLAAIMHHRVFDLSYPIGSMLAATRDPSSGWVLEHVAWDPIARIELSSFPPQNAQWRINYPAFLGNNPAFWNRVGRVVTQNNWAFTLAPHYDGTRDSLVGIEDTIYAAAYHATSVPHPRVVVIGVGGGLDVLTAMSFDASSITGVEINAATVNILRRTYHDYFRHWVDDPRVRLVNAEGRNFLSRTASLFDVITLSGVDTYSGTPAAAHVFSENYLYTEEAFDLYLARLSHQGILSMQRFDHDMLRALITAVAVLRRTGIERPADHVVMLTVTGGGFTSMLVKKSPFTAGEVRRVQDWAAATKLFSVSAAPGLNGEPVNVYQLFLTAGTPDHEETLIALYPFDISPANDDRPFFFHTAFWWHLFTRDPGVRASVPVMEYSVLVLVGVVGLTAALCIFVPLRYLAALDRRTPDAWRYAVFFAGTAIGYLGIELALIQRFGLFLGHPNYALSVVLASLLFATGVGSLFSAQIVAALGRIRFVSYLLAAILVTEYVLIFPHLAALSSQPLALRAAIVVALVAPVGVCLGTFVPSGLERLKKANAAFIPWAWGINGIFSVLAPILSIALSITWGISALLITAIPVYLIVGFVFPAPNAGLPRAVGQPPR